MEVAKVEPLVVVPTEKEETHFEADTEIGGHYAIDITPAKKFAKQQQFSVTYSDPSGTTLTGNFLAKRLSIGEQTQVGVTKAMFARSLQVDANTDQLLHMFAYLQHTLIEKPDWFKPADMFDDDLVISIYKRCLAFEASFRKPIREQG
jgi:hypothetical protein